ncbi:MAG: class I SAM-dependent methyltransferase [Myxococcota bacterium]
MQDVLDLEPYDFLDYGCSDGRSLELAVHGLGGVRGLGLDSSTEKVEQAKTRGHDAIEVDATRMPKCRGSVAFAILSHFLEHLPGVRDASRCLRHAIGVSQRFVYVQQPWFDSDFHLFRRGLKLYWSNWTGHTNRMTTLAFHSILQPLVRQSRLARYCLYGRDRIASSLSCSGRSW